MAAEQVPGSLNNQAQPGKYLGKQLLRLIQ
jgi:hypothetical protein